MSTKGKSIICKGAVIWEFNKPVSIETIEVAPPKDGEIRVKMISVGLCHSDSVILEGKYPTQPLPLIPGHEGAGIVESVGAGVTRVKAGDKVFTFAIPQCRKCRVCQVSRSNSCKDITIGGGLLGRARLYDLTTRFKCKGQEVFHMFGASSFAEYTVIPENSAVKIDPKTALDKACVLACGFPTGYGAAVNSVKIEAGDRTAVWGLGGVGLSTLLGCKDRGASAIIGVDVDRKKEKIAKKFGCTDYISLDSINKPVEEVILDLTNGEGLDFAFVCIGNIKAMESAVASLSLGGSMVIVGVTDEGALMKVSPSLMLANRKIVGSLLGDYKALDDIPKLVDLYNEGKLPLEDLITHRFAFEQINEAFEVMKSGKSIRSVIQIAPTEA